MSNKSEQESLKDFIEAGELKKLGEYIVDNPDDLTLSNVCGEMYNKHKKALSLVYKYRRFKNPQFYDIADAIKDDSDLILDHSTNDEIYFIPCELDNVIPKVGKSGKVWPTDRILLFSIERRLIDLYNPKSRLMLSLVFGPGDKKIRDELYNIAKQTPQFFLSPMEDGRESYFEFHYPRDSLIMKPTLAISGENTDVNKGKIRTEIEEWINDFKHSAFSKLTENIKKGMTKRDKNINTIHDEFRIKLKEISNLSKKINKNNNKKILGLINEHV